MKSERRHELQTNELANRLARTIERIKPYTNLIIGAIVLLVGVGFAAAYINSQSERSRAMAWTSFFDALESGDPQNLIEVADTFDSSPAAHWALLAAGDRYREDGLTELFRDRTTAKENFEQSAAAYAKLPKNVGKALLKQRILFGTGQTQECQFKLDDALGQYQAVAKQWEGTAVGELAKERADWLALPKTRQWYEWFAQQEPIAAPLTPPTGLEGLPDLPDFSLPPAAPPTDSSSPGTDALLPETNSTSSPPEGPADTVPGTDVAPQTDTTPPTDAPADSGTAPEADTLPEADTVPEADTAP